MLFVAVCNDKAGGLPLRLATRPAHLAWIEALGPAIKAAGPFIGADGQPNGSMLIIEAADESSCLALLARDPYALRGLFDTVSVRPWRGLIKNPEA